MQPGEQRSTGLSEIASELGGGGLVAGVALLAARFVFLVLRGRHALELEPMTEIAVSLAVAALPVACLAAIRGVKKEMLVGGITAAPLAYGISNRFVDAILAAPLPEMAPMATLILLLLGAIFFGSLVLALAALGLRAVRRWDDRAVALLGGSLCVTCLALTAHAGIRERAPGIETWTAYAARIESSAGLASARAELERDPSALVPIEPPIFFENAYAARVPELPTEGGAWTTWTTPGGLRVKLDRHGVDGRIDTCFLESGQVVVLLRSHRGTLLFRPSPWGPGRPCSLREGSDMHAGLAVSQASFGSPFGAPVGCAWLLLAGSACSLILLIASWRERRLARWIGTLEKASLVRAEDGPSGTAQLPDGQLGRLEGEAPEGGEAVLIPASERAGADAAYRGDARKRIAEWLSVSGSREEMIADRRRRAGKLDALALFVAVWLGLPALSAYVHGFVVSFG